MLRESPMASTKNPNAAMHRETPIAAPPIRGKRAENESRAFLLGATPRIHSDPEDTPQAKLKKTGGNTGNQIIAHALLGQFEHSDISWDYGAHPHSVRERFDLFVVAAANFLFPSFDFGGMADYIEKADLPVAIVGLGAQASSYDSNLKLMPGTERFLKVVAERAVSIGVRGPFTEEVLSRRGINNVTVTGCPSFYMKGAGGLAIRKKSIGDVKALSVNASRDVISHAFDKERMMRIVKALYRLAIDCDADFIAQSEPSEIEIADSKDMSAVDQAINELAAFLADQTATADVKSWASKRMRVFFEVEKWVAAVRQYDFVVGNRFHGNMIAIQNDIPAFVVCHDTRTEEMCRFNGLPHANIVELDQLSVSDLYDRVNVDTLNARYDQLFPRYVQFLTLNGLKPTRKMALESRQPSFLNHGSIERVLDHERR
jgi:polysaccharide pyruvyl transferase WcaK-like protein